MTARTEMNGAKRIVCLVLAAITLALFWRARSFEFLCYDDPTYITLNYHVQSGLNWSGVVWAFSSVYASNWHPLTWLSHMLDFQVWGNHPGGHHLTNVLFHTANVILLFLVLCRMTGATWRSALVAAFFAWHPLHVESVAWISERKDVLSTFFWLLAVAAYARYAEESKVQSPKSKVYYVLSLVSFALGLLSKPMVITLPCVLLLLDFWPLERIPNLKLKLSDFPMWRGLVFEKLPFFALASVSAGITLYAQANTISSVEQSPIDLRLANAVVSYAEYIVKLFWPSRLAVFYPHPDELPIERAGLALLFLAAVSFWSLLQARRLPCLVTGWFWFLGTLVPVIGIIQVGQQAMADRYSYVPSVGLFIALIWALAEWSDHHFRRRQILTLLAGGAVLSCIILTHIQLGFWKNDTILFSHARDVTSRNFVAYAVLASKKEASDPEGAITDYNLALAIKPNSTEALFGKGRALLKVGKPEEAIASYRAALEIDPNYPEAHNGLGVILAQRGELAEAETEYRAALKTNPDHLEARLNLALALFKDRQVNEAIAEFNLLLAAQPDSIDALVGLGSALVVSGKPDSAIVLYTRALRLKPDNPEAHRKLGTALVLEGKSEAAMEQFRESLRVEPDDPGAHYELGSILSQHGETAEAIQHYEAALRALPDFVEVLNNLAWIRAVCADSKYRDGAQAVRLASRACELTHDSQPLFLGTLAAALAEAGRFPEAVNAARKARDLASAAGLKDIAARNDELLARYESNRPYHE